VMKSKPNLDPEKNEMDDYLEDYVAEFDLPYRMKTLATRIEKENDFFNIFTVNEKIQSRRVIVASGAFQKPYIPPIIKNENPVVSHVHSSLYTEPKDINNGTADRKSTRLNSSHVSNS